MDANMTFKLNKFDKVTLLDNSTLIFEDDATDIRYEIGWRNARKIALQYLKQADDKERESISKELYDISYGELEAKYLEASNEADNLKEEIESLRQSKSRNTFNY
jgi:ABC-type multidrug transport system ATPase subunit